MTAADLVSSFRAAHRKGNPLVIYNIWDVASSKAVAAAGAKAIGTSSWAMSSAYGVEDGEKLEFHTFLDMVQRICSKTCLPVTADFESGFAVSADAVAENARKLINTGIAGLNLEDQQIEKNKLFTVDEQAKRLAAIKKVTEISGHDIFLNARTDLFLRTPQQEHRSVLDEAADRASAYRLAGADGIFVPGLLDHELIAALCSKVELPVNVMVTEVPLDYKILFRTGIARLSFGPGPFIASTKRLENAALTVYSATNRS